MRIFTTGGSLTPATTSTLCWTGLKPGFAACTKYVPAASPSNPNRPSSFVVELWTLSPVMEMATSARGRMAESNTTPRITPVVSVACRPNGVKSVSWVFPLWLPVPEHPARRRTRTTAQALRTALLFALADLQGFSRGNGQKRGEGKGGGREEEGGRPYLWLWRRATTKAAARTPITPTSSRPGDLALVATPSFWTVLAQSSLSAWLDSCTPPQPMTVPLPISNWAVPVAAAVCWSFSNLTSTV